MEGADAEALAQRILSHQLQADQHSLLCPVTHTHVLWDGPWRRRRTRRRRRTEAFSRVTFLGVVWFGARRRRFERTRGPAGGAREASSRASDASVEDGRDRGPRAGG